MDSVIPWRHLFIYLHPTLNSWYNVTLDIIVDSVIRYSCHPCRLTNPSRPWIRRKILDKTTPTYVEQKRTEKTKSEVY